ncbi:sterol desaturase family protein [Candidatus Uabimicrobium amorphum]|uniref:Sterol desaturase n=1 Tax=Uabimicrobium amorphum TaxID=2596890 RepID=A0A5S9IUM2_UABAM|nr:sterol desaturase family protein [Candidatus Uabimicrobium amorphum]BBM88214.1 sterol desaturase [Candidatus Uabimicrobium amorphum]
MTQKMYIVLGTLFVLGIAENLFSFYKSNRSYWQKIRDNYGLAVVNTVVVNFAFVFLLSWITTQTLFTGILSFITTNTYTSGILAFLVLDFFMYMWHRLMHEWDFAWNFHQVHHSELDMNTSSSFRFHFVEIAASKIFLLLWIGLWGIDVVFYFMYEAVFMVSVLLQHSNIHIPYKLDKLMSYVVVTPNFHRIHHSQDTHESNANYSSILTIWDWVFGTLVWNHHPQHIKIGMKKYPLPQNVWQLLKMPWS